MKVHGRFIVKVYGRIHREGSWSDPSCRFMVGSTVKVHGRIHREGLWSDPS